MSHEGVPTGMARGLGMDLCHWLWVQRAEQAAVLAAVLPGEMMDALWSDREGRDAVWEGCSDGVNQCVQMQSLVFGGPQGTVSSCSRE